MYAQVVFPLSFRNSFTYSIPPELNELVQVGVRVVVPFGKRVLTGFVVALSKTTEIKEIIKPIRDVLDELPIFDSESLKFYEWISEYYISSLGEALKNSVPYGSDVESKKRIAADQDYCYKLYTEHKKKSSKQAKLLAKLAEKEVHTISQLQKELKNKNIYSSLRSLQKIGAVTIVDEVENVKVKVKTQKFVSLAKSKDETFDFIPEIENRSPKQLAIIMELVSSKQPEIMMTELIEKTKSNHSSISSLEKKGLVKIFNKEIDRVFFESYNEELKDIILTPDQKKIVEEVGVKIQKKEFEVYLLHGITGSGKTQVYIDLAKEAIEQGQDIIILVPEISLTPQITSRFFNVFKEKVTVIHSRLGLGERYDSWRGIISGKYKIVIGPRSALFAPLKNPGIIIVDEEHDQSYKQQDVAPKYNARDAAIVKAKFSSCPVLLGSATPSVESMYNAKSGKYKLIELPERVDNAKLPKISLIDISIEKKHKRVEGIFSTTFLDAIGDKLKKKESVIILQNRRGFATQIFCNDCGEIVQCRDCSVAMVYHIRTNTLQCHYCGSAQQAPQACPTCGSINIKFSGTGTQRVEDELEYYFPNAKIQRIDSDSISKKGSLSEILNDFRKGNIDILVGTQMVSKGLDFSNVTLVGVVSAETSLWLPDFRADERTFQLLTQVSGRAGRSAISGQVLIQTVNHKHFVLQKVLENDYAGFYEKEIELRSSGDYPPFSRLALVEIKDEDERRAKSAIGEFHSYLKKYENKLKISPPAEAVIYKIKGFYRFQILVKSMRIKDPNGKILRDAVMNTFITFNQKTKFKDSRLIIDIDPQSII
ncbi:MAG: primosomal protein N' [Melioribacteraceae bacterium]